MKSTSEDTYGRPSSEGHDEVEWLEKKHALLKKISRDGDLIKEDQENITQKKERLFSEVERLEEENNLMAKSVKDFELQLSRRRNISQALFKKFDDLRGNLVSFLAREHHILSEIELFESEKAELSDRYSETSERLKSNITALESTYKEIGFMKGEVQALVEKMEMLEAEIPEKFRAVDNLDEKIQGTVNALKSLHSRMQGAERNIKMSYYNKKDPRRE